MRVYDTELKDVQIIPGQDDYAVCAKIFFRDVEIAFYLDEGIGADSIIKFSCEQIPFQSFCLAAWKYFASYPDLDTIQLAEMRQSDFTKYQSNLPKIRYRDWSNEKIISFFISKLVHLYQYEQQFYQALQEGYKEILVIRYVQLQDAKWRPEEIYYTDGSKEQFEKVLLMIKHKNYMVSRFSSLGDFLIREGTDE